MILLIIVGVIFLFWLSGLTFILLRTRSHYNNLTGGTDSKTLETVLTEILKDITGAKKHILELQESRDILEKEGALHIQKIGLLRFNPFNDTGGDQSFILSLLNNHNTGIVISGLYSRSGTRWYAKRVEKGKGIEHELSVEERKAIELARAN
ncbi:MAG TPA: DUF4446 family protein [Patescibacteria group bacterium]|nr:DUF4446 family protein [Patescibacteria group bacterium]